MIVSILDRVGKVQYFYCSLCSQWADLLSLSVLSPRHEIKVKLLKKGTQVRTSALNRFCNFPVPFKKICILKYICMWNIVPAKRLEFFLIVLQFTDYYHTINFSWAIDIFKVPIQTCKWRGPIESKGMLATPTANHSCSHVIVQAAINQYKWPALDADCLHQGPIIYK